MAKALLNEPELLLLDEPTASLDPDTADWVRGMFRDYQRQIGATLLLASHNMTEVERLCDDVVMMKRGRIVDRGSPAALLERYDRATLEDVFWISPATVTAREPPPNDRRPADTAAERSSAPRPAAGLAPRLCPGAAPCLSDARILDPPGGNHLLAFDQCGGLGFITQIMAGHSDWVSRAAGIFLGAIMLWDVMFRANLGVALSFLEEMWSRNLGHLSVSPLHPIELIGAMLTMSLIRLLFGMVPVALLTIPLYHYSIFTLACRCWRSSSI